MLTGASLASCPLSSDTWLGLLQNGFAAANGMANGGGGEGGFSAIQQAVRDALNTQDALQMNDGVSVQEVRKQPIFPCSFRCTAAESPLHLPAMVNEARCCCC